MAYLIFIFALLIVLISGILYKLFKDAADKHDAEQEKFFEERLILETASIRQQFELEFLQWKADFEKKIRSDAVQRSQSATVGKITEHLVPYFPEFEFNPIECRFVGSPIDLIVFKGLDSGKLDEVVFIEIKTGDKANLSTRERQLRDAIKTGKVSWQLLKIERKDISV